MPGENMVNKVPRKYCDSELMLGYHYAIICAASSRICRWCEEEIIQLFVVS